jgi:hypothetical protein
MADQGFTARRRPVSAVAASADVEGNPRQNPSADAAGAIAAGDKGGRTAIKGPIPETIKSYPGPPMTLGSAAAAHLRFEVWCKQCGHRSEPEPAEQAR